MADRRCIAKTICLSDAFLDMPYSSRCLYFTLLLNADDDGFVNNPKSLMRISGATNDDMNVLLAKKFVLAFESGVIVIKHWRVHNLIQKDRYVETKYKEEKSTLELDENKAYRQLDTTCIQNGYKVETQYNLIKDNLIKDNLNNSSDGKSKRFAKPTIQEITDYINEKGYSIDANRFFDYYESNGWKVGRNPMKDWKACLRTWASKDKKIERKEEDMSIEELNKRLHAKDYLMNKKQVFTLDEMNVEQADIEAIKKTMFKKEEFKPDEVEVEKLSVDEIKERIFGKEN